ncbi:TPA: hypothetical protein MA058_003365 [Klebsiella pneumoniae]|nr:hypothetical protein [Klebsiella pneumoniae]
MTKSTITRDELNEVISTYGKHHIAHRMANALLAAIDSEPDCNERQLFCSTDTARMRKAISVSAGTKVAPIYHHAKPEPVVPDNRAITVVLKYTSEPHAFAPWVAKAFYQFHKDTVDSCVKAFSEACNESNIKLEIIYK